MIKISYIPLFVIMFLITGCGTSFKSGLIKTAYDKNSDDAIYNAILDFSNTSKWFKYDSVFYVIFKSPVHEMLVEQVDYRSSRWVIGEPYEGSIAVRIAGSNCKCEIKADTKIGVKNHLPSRYIEMKGKLFFWYDDDYPFTEEMLSVLKKYNFIEYVEEFMTTECNPVKKTRKATHYYFCQNNLSKYTKVVKGIGLGYYEPPKINCNN